jgi:hypothetical protein
MHTGELSSSRRNQTENCARKNPHHPLATLNEAEPMGQERPNSRVRKSHVRFKSHCHNMGCSGAPGLAAARRG